MLCCAVLCCPALGLQSAGITVDTLTFKCCWPQLGNTFADSAISNLLLLQIPCLVRMSKAALEEGKCVVIGLQSTREARTADVVAERGELLDDYVSGPRVRPTAFSVSSGFSVSWLQASSRMLLCLQCCRHLCSLCM